MLGSYDIMDDVMFKDYLSSHHLSDESIEKYSKLLNKFCKIINMSFKDFIDECKSEQDIVVEEELSTETNGGKKITKKRVIPYDVDDVDSFIKKTLDEYVDYCKKKGNRNNTINDSMFVIRSFLNHHKVNLPRWKPLPNDKQNWELLEKEDFNFIMNDSNIVHQSLITFMLSSGIRIGDCLDLTIRDFMNATKDYHDFVDVEDFIDNAPEDMIGYWDFKPKKTQRYNRVCKTFNSAESSNYILQNLRRIKNQYLPRKSSRVKKQLKISKDYALFGSQRGKYKEKILVKSITDQFTIKNKKLYDWRVHKLKKAIDNGELSDEDFDEEMARIPKFHAHACRKYFISTISKHCSNLRLCALMEGHASPISTDESYVKKEFDEVKEAYLSAHDDLTLSKIETKVITNKGTEEVLKKIKVRDKKISELENQIEQLKEEKNIMSDSEIENIVNWYFLINIQKDEAKRTDEENVICLYAIEIAQEDKINFEASEKYLEPLINKAKVRFSMNPQEYDAKVKESYNLISKIEINQNFNLAIWEVTTYIMGNGRIKEMVENKQDMLKFKIIQYLNEFDCKTIDDLTDDILKSISEKVVSDII